MHDYVMTLGPFMDGIHLSDSGLFSQTPVMQSFDVSFIVNLGNCWINNQIASDMRCYDTDVRSG